MKNIQNRKTKGLSGSVLAAIVAAVLLLAGSSLSANPGALAQADDMQDQQHYDSEQQQGDIKLDESGAMGESESSDDNPFGGGPIEESRKVKDYAKFVLDESTDYTVKGLKEFSKASKDFIKKGDNEKALKDRHKELDKAVGEIKDAKGPRMQAERASQAFKDASQLFADIQEMEYPNSSHVVQPVKTAAEKITGDQSLAMQLGDVQNFFVESGKALLQLGAGGEGIGGGPADEATGQDSMDSAPSGPSDTEKPVSPGDEPAGGGPSDDGAAPGGGAPSGY